MNIFISSSDNKSGKTIIAAGMAAVMQSLGYKAGVYKPIQTGAVDKGKYLQSYDLTFVKMLDPYITTHSTYMLKTKALPVTAAEIENTDINLENIRHDYNILVQKTDILITESSGGLMTPAAEDFLSFKIPLSLELPVVFVITPDSGSVNHYLNELNSAKSFGLKVIGVIINKYPLHSDSPEIKAFPSLIEKYGDVKILGLIRNFKGKSISSNILLNEILNGIDLEDVFNMKIPKLSGF